MQLNTREVSRVEDHSGNVVATYTPTRRQVLTASQNAKVVYALQQVIQRGTATSAKLDRPAAGKTGTVAEGDRGSGVNLEAGTANTDAWFTGFVPGFTASVWMGYEQGNRVMPASFQGASYPAEIWKRFMTAALAGSKPKDFPASDGLSDGKFLTSWGGTRYLNPAWSVGDFANGVASPSQASSQSDGSSGSPSQNGSQQSGGSPSTTTGTGGGGGGGGPPPSTAAPASTPPPQTQPPQTQPPATPPASGPPTTQMTTTTQ